MSVNLQGLLNVIGVDRKMIGFGCTEEARNENNGHSGCCEETTTETERFKMSRKYF